jgi:cytidylate kinase
MGGDVDGDSDEGTADVTAAQPEEQGAGLAGQTDGELERLRDHEESRDNNGGDSHAGVDSGDNSHADGGEVGGNSHADGGEVGGEVGGKGNVPTSEELTRVVAVDGPAGSGKSTVARLVAQALGWRFVDTGATYRAVTLAVLRSGASLEDPEAVAAAARRAQVDLGTDPSRPKVLLDGADVSVEVRSPEVTAHVSAVSAIPDVRELLVVLQRRLMGVAGAVVEGRDIATVVAPRAGLKVYLDARPEVRARRRAGESGPPGPGPAGADGGAVAFERGVAADLARRDALDSQTNRLEASDGAIHLDTSDLLLPEVVDTVVELARGAGLAP